MEKLIELLNEYSLRFIQNKYLIKWEIGEDPVGIYGYVRGEYGLGWASKLVIISREFGFIQWLVDNDKIDRERFGNSETKSSKYSDFELSYDTPREDYTNTLLMELAIQDEPIQFLIKILR